MQAPLISEVRWRTDRKESEKILKYLDKPLIRHRLPVCAAGRCDKPSGSRATRTPAPPPGRAPAGRRPPWPS
jgi:hypothetical protein